MDRPRQSFVVRWADLDANGHMANTAYLDTCVDARFGYFATRGLSAARFRELGVGPVVRRDEVDYHRELRFLDVFEVDLALHGLAEDGSRFALENRFFRQGGVLAARVVSTGGWLDLATRRLVVAPDPLREALDALPRSDGFAPLESSLRSRE